MTQSPNDAAALSNDIPTLESEISELTERLARTEASVKELRNAEDPSRGIFHAKEIFEAGQEKLRLQVEIKVRSNRVNMLRMGMDPDADREPATGLFQ